MMNARVTLARSLLVAFVAAMTPALAGCHQDAPPTTEVDAAEASAGRDGATLVVTADQTAIRTVDRLALVVRSTAPEGMVVREIVIDPESEGWTVVDREVPTTSLTPEAQVVRTDRLVLEPFLGGEYAIPPVLARFAAPGAPASIDLSTTPIMIAVESVLPQDGAAEVLAPPTGPVDPPEPEAVRRSPWLLAAGVFALGGIVVVVLIALRSRARRGAGPDPEAELRLLLAHPIKDPAESRDRLASILRRARDSHTSQPLEEMLDRLDTERYAPPNRRPTGSIADDVEAALLAVRSSQAGGLA